MVFRKGRVGYVEEPDPSDQPPGRQGVGPASEQLVDFLIDVVRQTHSRDVLNDMTKRWFRDYEEASLERLKAAIIAQRAVIARNSDDQTEAKW